MWNLRAQSFGSDVVWDGSSCAGGALNTRCVGFGIRWKVREIFSDGSWEVCCNTQLRMKPQRSTGLAEGRPTIFWNLPEEAFLESARRDSYIVLQTKLTCRNKNKDHAISPLTTLDFWLKIPYSLSVCVHAFANSNRLWALERDAVKTSSEEYLEFSDMAQCCCSRFQRSILQRFLLQGRIGYGFPIRLSKDWMCSSEKCWPNTAVDDLMKLIALSRL